MNRTVLHPFLDRWENSNPWLRAVIALAAAAAIGFVAVSGPYQHYRSWQRQRNLHAARAAVTDQSMQEARDRSLTALRADETCLEAFRILETATASLRDPWHSEIARALLSHPDSTDADRLIAFCGIAAEVPLGLLKQAWSNLPDPCRKDLRFVTVFADRLISENCCKEATLVLLAVPEPARSPALNRRLIRILILSAKPEGIAEAQRLISCGFPTDHKEISDWLGLLEAIPVLNLQPDLLQPVLRVLSNPACGEMPRAALMLARVDYASHSSRRTEILTDTIDRWKDREPEALAGFLAKLGLYQLLLDTLPPERVKEHPELLPRLLEAIAHSETWQRTIPLLDSFGDLLPTFEQLGHRAAAAAKTGDAPTSVLAWTDAKGEAKISPQPDAFLTLQRIMRDASMDKEAGQALLEAIRRGRGPLPLYADLKPLLTSLAQLGHDKILLEICTIYLPFECTNPVLITQLSYLACLNQLIEPTKIVAAMEHLGKGFPNEVPIQCVLATAYLCNDQPATAAETFDRMHLDPERLSNAYRAAYLATLVSVGRITKDDPRVTSFPWPALLPCERKKFSELIRNERKSL